ncbi:MAG: TetR/AcrR family transcriptional regulator [Pseudomonas sp.]|uniref:TetR/AcrR family transcriptional regulator n=1 Tax=Pseudomonas sp. TaxID=306 RepID=UPI0027328C95|nr:TetR/AcrR family transcriptional regulator [Pseudomonas sp.]MDP3846461.1 TetR/AcrR family transcriptional regulator [Pseudomonas sp.]
MSLEATENGAVRAVFEDLGGYGAVARQQGAQVEGPLLGHLQRTNIQLAAIPMFASKGLAETTVNDLLTAANVSRRTFYKYFSNKMEVLASIYQMSVSLLLARFGEMQPVADSPQTWLRAMVALFFDYHLAVGPIIRLMQEEALRADSPLAAHRQRAHLEMVRLLIERLEAGQSQRHPLTYRALIWALEAASLELLGRQAKRAEIEQAKQVMGDLLIAALCPSLVP